MSKPIYVTSTGTSTGFSPTAGSITYDSHVAPKAEPPGPMETLNRLGFHLAGPGVRVAQHTDREWRCDINLRVSDCALERINQMLDSEEADDDCCCEDCGCEECECEDDECVCEEYVRLGRELIKAREERDSARNAMDHWFHQYMQLEGMVAQRRLAGEDDDGATRNAPDPKPRLRVYCQGDWE